MKSTWVHILATASFMGLSGCQVGQTPALDAPSPRDAVEPEPSAESEIPSLASMIASSSLKVNVDAGFSSAMRQAIEADPFVLSAKSDAAALAARVRTTQADQDFKFDATVLAGIEDVTDDTAGVAAIFSAKRTLFDGGRMDAQIAAENYDAQAAAYTVEAVQNERAVKLAHAWIELEHARALKNLIDSRLEVLDPLLAQLEQVVDSGAGDASQIAAAQRTISLIRVTQADVNERYAQAKVSFINLFGTLPSKSSYDEGKLAKLVPTASAPKLAEKAPALLAKYSEYLAAEARLAAVKAKDNFNVGFEARLQKPFGGSEYGADESIGFMVTRTLYKGDQLTSQIENADASAKSMAEQVRTTFVVGERELNSARQMIDSMGEAIRLAREAAQIARDEIAYLRRQLIIGGSTLDSILSAEARLYEAESKEIGFNADRKKAQVTILGATGRLAKAFSIK